jgi:hypothetical protein
LVEGGSTKDNESIHKVEKRNGGKVKWRKEKESGKKRSKTTELNPKSIKKYPFSSRIELLNVLFPNLAARYITN